MKLSKKGALSGGMVALLIILGIVLWKPVLQPALGGFLGSGVGSPAGSAATTDNVVKIQTSPEDVTTTFRVRDKYSAGTNVDANGIRVFLNNGIDTDIGTVATGNSKTFSPGDKITVYGGENSTTYYTSKQSLDIPAQGTKEITSQLCAMDTSPTVTIYDENGDAATAIPVSSNDKRIGQIRIRATSQKCYGNPELAIDPEACFTYNSSAYTKVELLSTDGVARPAVGATSNISSNNAVTNKVTKCFTFPKVANTGEWKGNLVLETGSVNPGTGSWHVNVTLDDADYDLDADTLAEITGYEDEDLNNLGVSSYPTPNILTS